MGELGPIGRLGRFAAARRGWVFVVWALIAVGLGMLAPRVETALSGAGWQANGSESVRGARPGRPCLRRRRRLRLQVAVHSDRLTIASPPFRRTLARAERILAADPAVGTVTPPRPGLSISRDGHTA